MATISYNKKWSESGTVYDQSVKLEKEKFDFINDEIQKEIKSNYKNKEDYSTTSGYEFFLQPLTIKSSNTCYTNNTTRNFINNLLKLDLKKDRNTCFIFESKNNDNNYKKLVIIDKDDYKDFIEILNQNNIKSDSYDEQERYSYYHFKFTTKDYNKIEKFIENYIKEIEDIDESESDDKIKIGNEVEFKHLLSSQKFKGKIKYEYETNNWVVDCGKDGMVTVSKNEKSLKNINESITSRQLKKGLVYNIKIPSWYGFPSDNKDLKNLKYLDKDYSGYYKFKCTDDDLKYSYSPSVLNQSEIELVENVNESKVSEKEIIEKWNSFDIGEMIDCLDNILRNNRNYESYTVQFKELPKNIQNKIIDYFQANPDAINESKNPTFQIADIEFNFKINKTDSRFFESVSITPVSQNDKNKIKEYSEEYVSDMIQDMFVEMFDSPVTVATPHKNDNTFIIEIDKKDFEKISKKLFEEDGSQVSSLEAVAGNNDTQFGTIQGTTLNGQEVYDILSSKLSGEIKNKFDDLAFEFLNPNGIIEPNLDSQAVVAFNEFCTQNGININEEFVFSNLPIDEILEKLIIKSKGNDKNKIISKDEYDRILHQVHEIKYKKLQIDENINEFDSSSKKFQINENNKNEIETKIKNNKEEIERLTKECKRLENTNTEEASNNLKKYKKEIGRIEAENLHFEDDLSESLSKVLTNSGFKNHFLFNKNKELICKTNESFKFSIDLKKQLNLSNLKIKKY